jgi:transcriptional regulator of met regulon
MLSTFAKRRRVTLREHRDSNLSSKLCDAALLVFAFRKSFKDLPRDTSVRKSRRDLVHRIFSDQS